MYCYNFNCIIYKCVIHVGTSKRTFHNNGKTLPTCSGFTDYATIEQIILDGSRYHLNSLSETMLVFQLIEGLFDQRKLCDEARSTLYRHCALEISHVTHPPHLFISSFFQKIFARKCK